MEIPAYSINLTEADIQQYWRKVKPEIVITPDEVSALTTAEDWLRIVVRNDLRRQAYRMLDLINEDRLLNPRESRNAGYLQWHELAAQVAHRHCGDMVGRGFIDHVNPDGETPFDRMKKAGIRFRCAGENLASGFPTVEATELAFMSEPPYEENHRANILNPCFTHVGIGIVENRDGTYVIAQNFVGLI